MLEHMKQVPGRESSMESLRPMKAACSVPITADAPMERVCTWRELPVCTDRDGSGLATNSGEATQVDRARH